MTAEPAVGLRAAGVLRVVRSVFRSPALRRVMLAFLLFNAMEYATWVAVLLYAYDATGPASVGVVALIQLVPSAVFAATAAAVADRYRRDRVLLAGYVLQAISLALTAAAMLLGAPPVVVYAFATVTACLVTLTRPTQGALMPTLARTPEELTAANGMAGSVEGLGTLLGPLAAAAILVVATPGSVFLAGAVASLIGALLVVRLPKPAGWTTIEPVAEGGQASHSGPEPYATGADEGADEDIGSLEAEPGRRRIVRGLRTLAANPDAGLVVGLLSVRLLVIGALDVLYVLLAMEVLGTGASGAGVLNAAMGLGTIAGGALTFALAGRRRLAPALALGAITVGLALVVLGGTTNAAAATLLLAVTGMGFAVVDVTGRTLLQRVARDRVLARLLGALEGIGMASLAVGSILVPVLVGLWSIPVAVVAIGLVYPVVVGVTWIRLRSIDEHAHVPVRELALLRRNAVLAPLPAPQLESVARQVRWLTFEAGEVIIAEGDEGDRYYVLATGTVRITQAGRFLRDLASTGDGFGEIALLRDIPRTATATASEPVVVIALERADFLQAVTGHEQARAASSGVAEERYQYSAPQEPGPS
jgi:MFS family permease